MTRADAHVADDVALELDLRSEMPFVRSELELQQLLAIARHVEFRAGEHLFDAGSPIDRVYLVTDGEVEMVAAARPSWRLVGSGGVGFLDFMIGRPHGRTAIARRDVRALEIDAADYKEYLQDHIDLCTEVLGRLCTSLFDDMLASPVPALLLGRSQDPALSAVEPTLVDRLVILSRVRAFQRATVQALADLANAARFVRHAAGTSIATADARHDVISILVRGEVELCSSGAPPIRRGAVDLLCGVAELSSAPRRVSVRAVGDVDLLEIDREDLLDRMDEHFEVAQSLFAHLAAERESLHDLAASMTAPQT